jgi:hypothetical protein
MKLYAVFDAVEISDIKQFFLSIWNVSSLLIKARGRMTDCTAGICDVQTDTDSPG